MQDDLRFHGDADRPTDYFTGCAGIYDLHRQDYPAAAIDAILDGLARPVRLADVGCGTGLATRNLAARGADVVGVEPNDAMRRRAAAHPVPDGGGSIRYVAGTAEATGLPGDSVDAVVCSQSFHWFDPELAPQEFHRILRPGGRLALTWKRVADGNPLLEGYREIMDRARALAKSHGRPLRWASVDDLKASPLFTGFREVRVDAIYDYDLEGFLGRSGSASYFPASGAAYEALLDDLRALFERHQSDRRVELEGVTEVFLLDATP